MIDVDGSYGAGATFLDGKLAREDSVVTFIFDYYGSDYQPKDGHCHLKRGKNVILANHKGKYRGLIGGTILYSIVPPENVRDADRRLDDLEPGYYCSTLIRHRYSIFGRQSPSSVTPLSPQLQQPSISLYGKNYHLYVPDCRQSENDAPSGNEE